MRQYDSSSEVERIALERSGKPLSYQPAEKIGVIEVPDFPSLGQLTALRFLEWLQKNPHGVISLPTGKTPEHFIRWTTYYLSHWSEKRVQRGLCEWGLNPEKPEMKDYTFVQIDEFYPMNPRQENSFAYYINRFYFKQFGLAPSKALLMDTWTLGTPPGMNLGDIFPEDLVDFSLRFRLPSSEQEEHQYQALLAADRFAMEYEEKIIQLGGIGFFLGGIGPDGHIGFNVRGSDHFSTTRLTPINYETAAAAATDLGGIEISRRKAVITIGLQTITRNPTTTAIIISAGESKAKVVSEAIENVPSLLYPATALQKLPSSRFYLTQGSAVSLKQRSYHRWRNLSPLPETVVGRIITDIATTKKKRLIDLTEEDICQDHLGQLVRHGQEKAKELSEEFKARIKKGIQQPAECIYLHTGPHHDDIMLGYLPFIVHLVRSPKANHHFATFTSGFTSVTNEYTQNCLATLEQFLEKGVLNELLKSGHFSQRDWVSRNRDVYQYLDGVAANRPEMQKEGEARRMLRNLVELAATEDPVLIKIEIHRLKAYFAAIYPGKKDTPFVQKLKGMIREWEEELLWGHLGINCDHIFHLRLGFYTGDIFTPEPEWERDIRPIINLLEKVSPDVITVAFDPEGSGPDTHYKVLQAVSQALQAYLEKNPEKKVTVWGYRNVWHRFHPAEANIFVPVSLNSLAIMKSAFQACFGSQRSASFPSYEIDGPFSELAQKIMVEQYAMLKTCLGRDFFYNNPIARLRATRGFVFLKEMTAEEFFQEAALIKRLMERE
ncbi:MAG: glucosamine-6-phosphate deaminase [Candidatus Omnitrophica bacterium]|nr:glucosamine-6-phosphate deaminase [Candidatus Omnitrophota bacterium]